MANLSQTVPWRWASSTRHAPGIRQLLRIGKHVLKVTFLKTTAPAIITADFRQAQAHLLWEEGPLVIKAPTHGSYELCLSPEEQAMLSQVSLKVDPFDAMYVPGQAAHYLSVGLSAMRCIGRAMEKAGLSKDGVHNILDFPVGYGRVLRFLKAGFPNASISGAEIDSRALQFCMRQFSIDAVTAEDDFSEMSPDGKFDLIWCGSLVTHFRECETFGLLRMFRDHLTENGVCVFSAHGPAAAEWVREKKYDYNLSPEEQQHMLANYDQTGYGYGEYSSKPGYGVSLAAPERMKRLIAQLGTCGYYEKQAWDHHHDVYAFQR